MNEKLNDRATQEFLTETPEQVPTKNSPVATASDLGKAEVFAQDKETVGEDR